MTNMKFEEAEKLLLAGKQITRDDWSKEKFICLDSATYFYIDEHNCVFHGDTRGDNWKVWEHEPTGSLFESEENLLINAVKFLQNNFLDTEVKYVLKVEGSIFSNTEYLKIVYETKGRLDSIELPPFHKGSSFEGLMLNLPYNIKDLIGECE